MKLPVFAPALQPLRNKWDALDAQSKRVVMTGAVVALLLFFVFAVWVPADRSRKAAADRIPALEAARVAMLSQAEDVKRLRAQPPSQTIGKLLDLASLRTTFAGAEVTAVGAGRYRVLINDGRFGGWLASLRTLNGALVVGELSVTRLPGPGERVRIEAVLQPAGAAPKTGAGS